MGKGWDFTYTASIAMESRGQGIILHDLSTSTFCSVVRSNAKITLSYYLRLQFGRGSLPGDGALDQPVRITLRRKHLRILARILQAIEPAHI